MAGSYRHVTTKRGKFRSNESFCELIENLGDAYEAAEEMFGMIHWLAHLLALETAASPEDLVGDAVAHYREGLALGGVQKARLRACTSPGSPMG